MLTLEERITAFHDLSLWLEQALSEEDAEKTFELNAIIQKAYHQNGWFTTPEVRVALRYWQKTLNRNSLNAWISSYPSYDSNPKSILLVLAGNIPMVGFHDILSVILSGQIALIKCASNDSILIPFLLQKTTELNPKFSKTYSIASGLTKVFDAVIATGSNNASRYFEQYFSKVPHVIRKNRTSIAVLTGNESDQELNELMLDVFQYYGLGCRNVTKIYVPNDFEVNRLFRASTSFSRLLDNHKYVNNYTYHKTILMLERKDVLDNDLFLLLNNPSLFSPVSVLHYERYNSQEKLDQMIEDQTDQIQCVIGKNHIPFGKAQEPMLNDYADGIDTVNFLVTL